MRKAFALTACLVLILALSCSAAAASSATGAVFSAAVSPNGSCQVTVDVQLYLETPQSGLTFPLPADARGISVNGGSARTSRSGDALLVNLNSLLGNTVGAFSLRLQYTLPNVLGYNELEQLEMTLPMLSGFQYGVDVVDFTVTLPGEISAKPAFFSGYYQQSIEASMEHSVSGNTVTGTVFNPLKDRETLTMTLAVTPDQFPQDPIKQLTVGIEQIIMIVLAVLAGLYWLIFLRCAPLLRSHCAQPPEGFSAGQLPCALGQGADLSMLVLTWAQLGYLLIHLESSGRVMLHKRMDMGNERSAFEVHTFRALFGRRSIIDGTGYHYANLYQKTAALTAPRRELFRRGSGNPLVMRVLCAGIGLCGGIHLGIALAQGAILGFLVAAILAGACAIAAWLIQDWALGLHLRHKRALALGLGIAAVWLLLGMLSGTAAITAWAVIAQLLCGLLTLYGGRRTPTGRQTAGQILGLRYYLKTVSADRLHHVSDPDYFFSMLPYALALGVDKSFAQRFGSKRLSACPYLTTGMDAHMSAPEWVQVMRRAVDCLDQRHRRLFLERLLGR